MATLVASKEAPPHPPPLAHLRVANVRQPNTRVACSPLDDRAPRFECPRAHRALHQVQRRAVFNGATRVEPLGLAEHLRDGRGQDALVRRGLARGAAAAAPRFSRCIPSLRSAGAAAAAACCPRSRICNPRSGSCATAQAVRRATPRAPSNCRPAGAQRCSTKQQHWRQHHERGGGVRGAMSTPRRRHVDGREIGEQR